MKSQRRAKPEDIAKIFRYRGCGFQIDEISTRVDLSKQTVSYHLSKLKDKVEENSISHVVEVSLGHYPRERLIEMETMLSQQSERHFQKCMDYEMKIEQLKERLGIVVYDGGDEEDEVEPYSHNDDEVWFFMDEILPKEFLENGGVVIDGSDVLFLQEQPEPNSKIKIVNTIEPIDPIISMTPNQKGLTHMISRLEEEGYPVIVIMAWDEYEYAISGKMPKFSDYEMKSLRNLRSSRKLLLLGSGEGDFTRTSDLMEELLSYNKEPEISGEQELTERISATLSSPKIFVVSNERELNEGDRRDGLVNYAWVGTTCIFEGLPTVREIDPTEPPINAISKNAVRGAVMSFLSHGEYVPLQAIHMELASVYLGIDPLSPKERGWSDRLKDELSLTGQKFSAQLSKLMGDAVEIKKENKQILVRKK